MTYCTEQRLRIHEGQIKNSLAESCVQALLLPDIHPGVVVHAVISAGILAVKLKGVMAGHGVAHMHPGSFVEILETVFTVPRNAISMRAVIVHLEHPWTRIHHRRAHELYPDR